MLLVVDKIDLSYIRCIEEFLSNPDISSEIRLIARSKRINFMF
jgi:hypothetical protein